MGENVETMIMMPKQEQKGDDDEVLIIPTDDDVLIDLDFLWENISGPMPDSPEIGFDDIPVMDYGEGLEVGISQGAEVPISSIVSPSYNSDVSDCRISEGFSESTENSTGLDEKIEPSLQIFTDHGYSNNVPSFVPDQGSTSFIQPGVWCQNGSETAPFDALNHNGGGFSFHGATHNAATSEFCYPNYEDKTSNDVSSNEFSSHDVGGAEIPDPLSENDGQHILNLHNLPFSPHSPGFTSVTSDYHWMGDVMGDGKIHDEDIDVISYDHFAGNGVGSHNNLSYGFGNLQNQIEVKKHDEFFTSNDIVYRSSGDGVMSRNSSSLTATKNYVSRVKDEKDGTYLGTFGEVPIKASSIHDQRSVPGLVPLPSGKSEINGMKMEIDVPKFSGFCPSNITYQGNPNSTFAQSYIDDDSDLQIIEELSQPARTDSIIRNASLVPASHFSSSKVSVGPMGMGHSRLKPNDERVIYRVALQDLSQPKSEATPPEGLLAVPLLKHQRIALHWMVNKETKGACCSGGILADDQGLGKTVSTISLILKERSPPSKAVEQLKAETLHLDEDDDDVSEIYDAGERANDFHIDSGSGSACSQSKGRPAAGTLVVCPTSVLRQWSEELHNKVTSKANLSVLVYHGSNRTKDPFELAKYDVVVTTYAIVSQEVPKQPNVNEVDDSYGTPFMSCNKRKLLGNASDKKPSKKKKSKNVDYDDLIDKSGPLAKVGWFRVVLDEAQSIKNHRTLAARACWGLRAKRRWCLSGTPIQNSIEDLYSYFRFLRHEPYAVFKTFCEQLKVPIQRNPKNGFRKLQAVLKTIMLRRTKATRLDGEPIINLPPKTIELKQVDFSKAELDFYRTLEADSRAQFAEYAANGTVEQNYVNILLMLLRLRQACDHPLLVKQSSSHSKIASSIVMAKKLPRDRQAFLLNCLEASLAICGICSDPPEDSVVTVCGHVFCNQCILEHMLGDDPHCPAKNCKTRLSMSCVFSVMSLRSAVSDNLASECTTQSNGSELVKASNPYMSSYPEGSSKIKAVLQILMSLAKPSDCVSSARSSEEYQICNLGGESSTKDENKNTKMPVKVAGEKAIVFSQWTKMLDLLEACLKNTSIQYRRLDGTMAVTARDKAVKDFNSIPQVTVMIMSLKAASLGLNMVAACRVVLLDLWWNPTTEDQAIDRAHRIGQTRPVSVYRLTVRDTVEDRILALQQRKRQMVASAFGEDETGSQQTKLTVNDLKYLFRVD